MKATFDNSRIEIWNKSYINSPKTRFEMDKNVRIVQIEPTVREDNYIVEVIDRAEAPEEQEGET